MTTGTSKHFRQILERTDPEDTKNRTVRRQSPVSYTHNASRYVIRYHE